MLMDANALNTSNIQHTHTHATGVGYCKRTFTQNSEVR